MPESLNRDGQPASEGLNWKRRKDSRTDELIGLCRGILADGALVCQEAVFLLDWLERNKPVRCTIIGRKLHPLLQQALHDGVLSEDEEDQIVQLLMKIIGGTPESPDASISSELPLCDPPPNISFEGTSFCFTGKFVYGTRKKCQAVTSNAGGNIHPNPKNTTDYLVIGQIGSRDWAHSTSGRKIERAIEIRDNRKILSIISETHWAKSLPRPK